MKKIFLAALLMSSLTTFAQKGVPASAISDFKSKFPTAQKASWDKEDDNFEVEFVNNGIKMSSTYSKKGVWLETEAAVSIETVPSAAKESLKKDHKSAKVLNVFKVETTKPLAYEFEISEAGKKFEVIYDQTGVFIK